MNKKPLQKYNPIQAANIGRRFLDSIGWPRHYSALYKALGLKNTMHLPSEGIQITRSVAGIDVWVLSEDDAEYEAKKNKKQFVHRVLCSCPVCGHPQPASRLHQHIRSRTCFKQRLPDTKKHYWCRIHNREATDFFQDKPRCDPRLGGLMLPCVCEEI